MRGKGKSVLVKFITTILFVLVLVAAVGAIFKFTNVGDKIEDITNTTFRVKFNGIYYTGEGNVIVLPTKGREKFTVNGTNGFKVKVTPNVTSETDFTYSVNGREYPYGGEDFTNIFIGSDNVYGDCFYMDCSQGYELDDVLSRLWGGEKVEINGYVSSLYLITVTGSNGEIVSFQFGDIDVDIKLSDTELQF